MVRAEGGGGGFFVPSGGMKVIEVEGVLLVGMMESKKIAIWGGGGS